jgi:hypothetical protein
MVKDGLADAAFVVTGATSALEEKRARQEKLSEENRWGSFINRRKE